MPRLCRVQDDGTVIQVNEYLRQHFGYKHNHLGVAVGVLFAYIAIFGCALGIAKARPSQSLTMQGVPNADGREYDARHRKLCWWSHVIVAMPLEVVQ